MTYSVVFSNKARKQIKKMDRYTQAMIINWLDKHIEGCENPFLHGKVLNGNLNNQWRYQIGNYRVLCDIQNHQLIVLVINVGHRREVYE